MESTKIEYCDHTFSPWRGCRKVSPGCQNCFAERFWKRLRVEPGERQLASEAYWKQPLRWNRKPIVCGSCGVSFAAQTLHGPKLQPGLIGSGECCGPYHNARVLVDLCDWLDPEVDVAWLARFLNLIHETPNLTWLLLTKRPELWEQRIGSVLGFLAGKDAGFYNWLADLGTGRPPTNVWMGVSVEDQTRADERIPALLRIPAVKRWVSVEPMLGPVDLVSRRNWLAQDHDEPNIHWVVVGGESGPRARLCDVEWIRSIVQQGREACVPVFVKQMSGQKPGQQYGMPDDLWAIKEYPTTSST